MKSYGSLKNLVCASLIAVVTNAFGDDISPTPIDQDSPEETHIIAQAQDSDEGSDRKESFDVTTLELRPHTDAMIFMTRVRELIEETNVSTVRIIDARKLNQDPHELARVMVDPKRPEVFDVEIKDSKHFFAMMVPSRWRNFETSAEAGIARFAHRLAVVRGMVNGVVTSISIFLDRGTGPHAALMGGATYGLICYLLQKNNSLYNRALGRLPPWDRDGAKRRSSRPLWWALDLSWRTGRHAAYITGILALVFAARTTGQNLDAWWQWRDVAQEMSHSQSLNSLYLIPLAALGSAVSWGRWKQNEAMMFSQSHMRNEIINFGRPEKGIEVAKRIAVGAQVAAIVQSAFSVANEILVVGGAASATQSLGANVMMFVGVTGWAYYAAALARIESNPLVEKYIKNPVANVVSRCREFFSAE